MISNNYSLAQSTSQSLYYTWAKSLRVTRALTAMVASGRFLQNTIQAISKGVTAA
jgi:hypothetical protein